MNRESVPRRHLRVTLVAMMAAVAVLSLLLTLALPLLRFGWPPCLTPVQTARWVASNPGAARCVDCHARRQLDLAHRRGQRVPDSLPGKS